MSEPTCSEATARNSPIEPFSLHVSPTDEFLETRRRPARSNCLNPPSTSPKPLPAVAAASLLTTIQRSNGELEHLHEALGRIEDILVEERRRALTEREKARREAQQSAAQVQTLAQKINEEKIKRRLLREELATAAEHLKSSVEKNTALLSALEASQQENEVAGAVRVKLEIELEKSRNNTLHFKEEVMSLKESLEAGK
jgi:hypothetical protein